MNYVLVAALGLVAGVVSGLFGVGGAILVVPGLVLLAKLPQHTANGTSLAALLLPVGFLGFWQYYKRAVPRDRALDILTQEVKAGQLDTELFRLFIAARVFEAAP